MYFCSFQIYCSMYSRIILISIVIAAMVIVLAFLGYKSRKTKNV